MKEIVLVGSRCSVGKESLLSAFLTDAKEAVVADCSLEYNALVKVLDPQEIREKKLPFFRSFYFDEERCTHCRMCLGVCQQDALEVRDQLMTFYEYRCTHCGSCIKWCPVMALSHEEQSDVSLYTAKTRFGPLVFSGGFLEPSLQPEMIRAIRSHARQLAKTRGIDTVLINGSRGLRNTTIASIEGADSLIAVISPSPSALNDLKRIILFCRKSGIDPLVILNMVDLNPQQCMEMEKLCQGHDVIVIGNIPYNHIFRTSLAENKSVAEAYPGSDTHLAISDIWKYVMDQSELISGG